MPQADEEYQRIKRAADQWLGMIDAQDDLIILATPEGTISRCNRATALHLGVDIRATTGLVLADVLWQPNTIPRGPAQKTRIRLRPRNDWFQHTCYAIADGSHVHILHNINEQLQLEAVAAAVNISDNLSFMVSGIRHELGNPLNSVKMALSVLAERLPNLQTTDIRMYLDRVGEQVRRMEYLLQLLRSFSAHETITPVPVDLSAVLHDMVALSQTDLQPRGILLSVADKHVPRVMAEPRALQQILSNLIANASDAKRDDTPLRIHFEVTIQNDRVVLSVIDDGRGMTEAQQMALFRPFVTSKKHGNGLGLSIVRRMLSSLGATIHIYSVLNVGTSVEISFVIADTARN